MLVNLKQEARHKLIVAGATNLEIAAKAVWAAVTMDDKIVRANLMASQFSLGGIEKFKNAVLRCKTPKALDQLVTNALLKGEGMGGNFG